LSGIPDREETGIYNVILKVSDGEFIRTQDFDLEVQFNNVPPVITSDPKDSAKVDEVYAYGIIASDSEMDPLTYFVTQVPEWLVFYSSSHVLIGTPTGDDAGSHLIIIGVSDGIDTTYQVFNLEVVFETSVVYSDEVGGIKVYPNPASEYIDILLQDPVIQSPGDLIFELMDLGGRILLKREIINISSRIILGERNIGKGVYFYRIYNVKDKGRIEVFDKLIIQ
jgi:hypothetical protein